MGPESPANFVYGGGASGTFIHPVELILTSIAVLMILFAPRRIVSLPFLLVTFLGSIGQQFYVAGFHFYVLRLLIISGVIRLISARMMSRREPSSAEWTNIDWLFVAWACCRAIANVLIANEEVGAVAYQVGFLVDAVGGYCFVRYLIRDDEDVVAVIKVLAFLTVVFAVTMSFEKFYDQNVFGYLGILSVVPAVREGSIRAEGAFAHPILAGVFGVALVPLFWWLRQSGKARLAGLLGFCGSVGMMLMSASSTPLMAFLAAIIGWFAFPFRNRMRAVRWVTVIMLVGLHLIMKAPVWMLISRVDLIAGNSGYHRAMLIDQCIRHFSDWWLIGTTAAGTWGWDLWDTSNQFVQEAESGGLITFILFLMIISRSFRRIAQARTVVAGQLSQERYMWALSVTLFTQCVCFFGISYFDHTKIMWYILLAILIAATNPLLAIQTIPEPAMSKYLSPTVAPKSPVLRPIQTKEFLPTSPLRYRQ